MVGHVHRTSPGLAQGRWTVSGPAGSSTSAVKPSADGTPGVTPPRETMNFADFVATVPRARSRWNCSVARTSLRTRSRASPGSPDRLMPP